MTAHRRDGEGTPFGHWLRSHPELDAREHSLSATDCDMLVHRFIPRNERDREPHVVEHIMLVEVKCHGADVGFAQCDTLHVLDEILRRATGRGRGRRRVIPIADRRRDLVGAKRQIRWLGVHLLQLSSSRPDRSATIRWDGQTINETMLVELLRYERDPDAPGNRLDLRRHHLKPRKEHAPPLLYLMREVDDADRP